MDYSAEVQSYIDGVLSGEIVASRPVRLAVKRHEADKLHAGDRGYQFDEDSANTAIWFIETCCCHTRNSIGANAGDPLILSPSQKFIVWSLFGWKRSSDNLRRFERGHIEVCRKFGKSCFASAIALLMLVWDNPLEHTAEVFSAATKESQARIVFDEAKRMARRSPALAKRLNIHQKSIYFPLTEGSFQPIGSDSDTTDGLNPSCVIMDELHAWQKHHRGLLEKLTSAGGARLQPLWLVITTAGDERSQIWREERQYALRCAESALTGQIVDDTVFAFIACIDHEPYTCIECRGEGCPWCQGGRVEADDPFDEAVWAKAQPNLGYSVDKEWFRKGANEARQKPTSMNKFLRYYCNVMVSSSAKPIDPVLWANCSGSTDVEKGAFCCGGLDLGRADDFAAWTLVFPDHSGEETAYKVHTRSYTTEAYMKSAADPAFERWEEQGLLVVHPGDQIDLGAIEEDIVEQSGKYQLRSLAFDPTFALQMAQNLINTHGIECFKFGQGYTKYNEPLRKLLSLYQKGLISHGGNELLAWQAGNLIIRKDPKDLWMPDKVNSDGKIDAMVSLIMGLSECLFYQDSGGDGRFYETNAVEWA